MSPIFDRFNRLTPAEDERLAWLLEELGEAIQAIGKIKRHGYESDNRGAIDHTNRMALERELGDVLAAIDLVVRAGDLKEQEITVYRTRKMVSVREWLHHQPEEVLR